MRRLVLIFCAFLPVGLWGAKKENFNRLEIGIANPLSYNVAWAQTTGTNWGLGFGIAGSTNIKIGSHSFSLLLNVTKSQLLAQRNDGASNAAICREGFNPLSGPCSLIQVRLSPFYWLGPWGVGVSIVYNYFSDFTYERTEIYNTKRSNQSLGPTAAFRHTWGWFTLMAAVHFDYAVVSQAPSALTNPASLQVGGTIYAMFAIY